MPNYIIIVQKTVFWWQCSVLHVPKKNEKNFLISPQKIFENFFYSKNAKIQKLKIYFFLQNNTWNTPLQIRFQDEFWSLGHKNPFSVKKIEFCRNFAYTFFFWNFVKCFLGKGGGNWFNNQNWIFIKSKIRIIIVIFFYTQHWI